MCWSPPTLCSVVSVGNIIVHTVWTVNNVFNHLVCITNFTPQCTHLSITKYKNTCEIKLKDSLLKSEINCNVVRLPGAQQRQGPHLHRGVVWELSRHPDSGEWLPLSTLLSEIIIIRMFSQSWNNNNIVNNVILGGWWSVTTLTSATQNKLRYCKQIKTFLHSDGKYLPLQLSTLTQWKVSLKTFVLFPSYPRGLFVPGGHRKIRLSQDTFILSFSWWWRGLKK